MAEPGQLRYHARAFQSLGLTPCVSPEAERVITTFQEKYPERLAGAVREFFLFGGEHLQLGDGVRWRIISLDDHLDDLKDLEWAQFRSNPGLTRGREFVVLSHPYCNHDYQVYLIVDGADDPWVEDNMGLNPAGPFSTFILHLAEQKARRTGGVADD